MRKDLWEPCFLTHRVIARVVAWSIVLSGSNLTKASKSIRHFLLDMDVSFRSNKEGRSVFHGAIADSEPDGWARQVILRTNSKDRKEKKDRGIYIDDSPLTSLDFLLAVDDFSRIGALRFQDESGMFQREGGKGKRTAPPLIELDSLLRATRAVETDTETAADLEYLRGRGTSLGGLRPKCTVIDQDGFLSIGKFPSVHDTYSVTKGEVLALRIAAAAGIQAAEARIVESDGTPVALIKRFDRGPRGERIPYFSAATLLSIEDSHQVHTYTEIVSAVQENDIEDTISPNPMSEEDLKSADSYARAFARKAYPIIKQKIQAQGTVLGIGRLFYHSIRPLASEGDVITRSGLRKFIESSLNKTEEELNNPFAHVDVSNCILTLAIMKALHIQEIRPIETTTTRGLLISPAYWIEEK